MRYVIGIGGMALIQIGLTVAVILATAGGGSFVGLWAMLLAVVGIPLTALINALVVHTHRGRPVSALALRVGLATLPLPVAQVAVMILVSVFRL
ncbi:MAG: hypothetical protein ACOY82_17420 [Pseudomonadota bacterium]